MTIALDNVKASVDAVSKGVSEAVKDIQTLTEQLATAAAADSQPDIQAIADQLNTLAAQLEAAVNPPPPAPAS